MSGSTPAASSGAHMSVPSTLDPVATTSRITAPMRAGVGPIRTGLGHLVHATR